MSLCKCSQNPNIRSPSARHNTKGAKTGMSASAAPFMFGQDAIIQILQAHGGKATREQIKTEIQAMIKQGVVAASMETLYSRALTAMVRSYEINKITAKHTGQILYYEIRKSD